VVQDHRIDTGLPQLVLALITSNLSRLGVTRVRIDAGGVPGRAMGLLTDSIVVTDNLATVATSALVRSIGTCPIMAEIDRSLRTTLGI